MRHNAMAIEVGEWVCSGSAGIWQVYRVIDGVEKLRSSLRDRKRPSRDRLVFSKRLVDAAWKRAFSNEVASADLVRVLSSEDRHRLKDFLTKNPETMREFEEFQPSAIDLIRNLTLNVPASAGKEYIERLIQDLFVGINEGMTNDEILQRIASSQLAVYIGKYPINATLQLRCKDHELRINEYVFRDVQLLMH